MAVPAIKKIDISNFLDLAQTIRVADVRSPSEYIRGHIPGSINIPLFNDKEREFVGVTYKKEGRRNAVLKGLELTGPSIQARLAEALRMAGNNKILIYCWRGGMRSEAMSWLLSLGGMETRVLDGGYKSYRNYILSALSQKRKTIVLGGMTGSSKTHILRHIKTLGKQVIDLEALANHKGSAFGALGQMPQPSSEHFANLLFNEWKQIDNNIPVWMEDESINIGTVFMPDDFFNNLQGAPTLVLLMDIKTRLPRLIEEYSAFPPDLLIASINKISKRLGGENVKEAIKAVEARDFAKAIEITLKYYDKSYRHSIGRKNSKSIIYLRTSTDNIEENTEKLLEEANKITW